MKCGRCRAEINGNKCRAGLVQWLASGDPIQERINKEEAR